MVWEICSSQISLGYRQSQGDHTFFIKHSLDGKLTLLLVYVDDMIVTGKLGCKTSRVPIEQNHKIGSEETPIIEKSQYQRLVGKLICLSHTRPDITYDVSVVRQIMHDPRERHLQAVERILQVNEKDCCSEKKEHCPWKYIQMQTMQDRLWIEDPLPDIKQNLVVRSNAEVEFRAMTQGICEGFCCHNLAINIVHNSVQHDRTKHIEIDRHFIKEKLDSGLIITTHVSIGLQVADVFTKGFRKTRFQELNDKLRMIDIHLLT
ncbi:Copia protein, partial [Mucuna pruriens]